MKVGETSNVRMWTNFYRIFIAFQNAQTDLGLIYILILSASAGFLPYNFRISDDAKIFLGDSGSTFIGFTLAALTVYGSEHTGNSIIALTPPLLIFWILIFDMTYITMERIATKKVSTFKEWIDYVGKDHLHHRMLRIIKGKRKTVIFIYLVTIILCLDGAG